MENSTIKNIEASIVDSVVDDNLSELFEGVTEGIIDEMMEDGILKNIPIVKSIYSIGKVAIAIRDQFFAKKVLTFLKDIQNISQKDRQKFIQDLEGESGQNAGEVLTVILDRFDNIEKPKILANLLIAKVNGKITIEQFLRFSSIIDRAFLPDLKKLGNYQNLGNYKDVNLSLFSLGLVNLLPEPITMDNMPVKAADFDEKRNNYKISNLGKDLLEYGFGITLFYSNIRRQGD